MDERTSRQLALTRRLYLLWAVVAAATVLALCFFLYNMVSSRAPRPVQLGQVSDFAPDSVTLRYVNAQYHDPFTAKDFTTLALQVSRDVGGNFTVFFARSTDERFGALTPRQCVVEYDASSQRFAEPCGGAQWTKDGKYYAGPAPRDLDRFPVQTSSGNLMIQLDLIPGAAHS